MVPCKYKALRAQEIMRCLSRTRTALDVQTGTALHAQGFRGTCMRRGRHKSMWLLRTNGTRWILLPVARLRACRGRFEQVVEQMDCEKDKSLNKAGLVLDFAKKITASVKSCLHSRVRA